MSATHSTVASHGMFGHCQAIQASLRPSGLIRGDVTKSYPLTSTLGSAISPSGTASSATISLSTMSVPPSGGCVSRTQITVRPSGVTRPSA